MASARRLASSLPNGASAPTLGRALEAHIEEDHDPQRADHAWSEWDVGFAPPVIIMVNILSPKNLLGRLGPRVFAARIHQLTAKKRFIGLR